MPMTSAQVLEAIAAMHAKKGRRVHPMWVGMVEGTLSLDQVRYLCKQQSIIPLHNHNYHGRLYVSCPDPEWRERLAEVAYEEATGRIYANGIPHYKLYLKYAAALGISAEEMWSVDYCPAALCARLYLSDACSRFIEGVAACMLAGEAQIPGLFGRIAETLQKKFGLDDEAIAFWTVHDKADEDHGDAGRSILDRFVKTDEERLLVISTARDYINISSAMADEIWKTVQTIQ